MVCNPLPDRNVHGEDIQHPIKFIMLLRNDPSRERRFSDLRCGVGSDLSHVRGHSHEGLEPDRIVGIVVPVEEGEAEHLGDIALEGSVRITSPLCSGGLRGSRDKDSCLRVNDVRQTRSVKTFNRSRYLIAFLHEKWLFVY